MLGKRSDSMRETLEFVLGSSVPQTVDMSFTVSLGELDALMSGGEIPIEIRGKKFLLRRHVLGNGSIEAPVKTEKQPEGIKHDFNIFTEQHECVCSKCGMKQSDYNSDPTAHKRCGVKKTYKKRGGNTQEHIVNEIAYEHLKVNDTLKRSEFRKMLRERGFSLKQSNNYAYYVFKSYETQAGFKVDKSSHDHCIINTILQLMKQRSSGNIEVKAK